MAYHPYLRKPFSLSRFSLAKRWDVSISTIKRMEERGELRSFTVGVRTVRFRMEDILAFEEEHSGMRRKSA